MILWVLLENPLGGSVFIFCAIYCASPPSFDKNELDIEQVPVTISKKVLLANADFIFKNAGTYSDNYFKTTRDNFSKVPLSWS